MRKKFIGYILSMLFMSVLTLQAQSIETFPVKEKTNVEISTEANEDTTKDGSKLNLTAVLAEEKNLTTLVYAANRVQLTEKIKTSETLTIFAPTNDAFDIVPAKIMNKLMADKNKQSLKSLLAYHVVEGKIDASALKKKIDYGNGECSIKTLNGEKLIAYIENGDIILKDINGNTAKIISADLKGTNGYVHIIEQVLMPNLEM